MVIGKLFGSYLFLFYEFGIMNYVVIGFLEDSIFYYYKCGVGFEEYKFKIFLGVGLFVFVKFVVVGKCYNLRFIIFYWLYGSMRGF